MKTFTTNTTYTSSLEAALAGDALINDLCPQKINCNDPIGINNIPAPAADAEKELALLFLDIRNYTAMLQMHPPKELIQVISRLFSVFTKVVTNFKGRVIERAGDSLYAVFGLQHGLKEAVNQAYDAAKMMFETLNVFNSNYAEAYYGHPLEMGMGLHAGNVVVGQIDWETHQQLTVMGLPVNIASRLQAETKAMNNDMVISEQAYNLLDVEDKHEQRLVQLQGINGNQRVRLAGKPYGKHAQALANGLDMDFLLAISG